MFQKIKIALIKQDGGTQSRDKMNADVIKEYASAMADGVEFPPVVLFQDGSSYWLGDGFHRVSAAIKAKAKVISAEVRQGTFRDAILFSLSANHTHGLRMTNADKRRSVSRLLDDQEWSQWSNREIARRCGVSDPFVMQMRSERVLTVSTPKAGEVATDATFNPAPEAENRPEIETETQIAANNDALLEEDPKAAIEAPQPKPEPKVKIPDDTEALKARIAELEAENADLQERCSEAANLMQALQEENEAMQRTLDAEDLRGAFQKEVKRAHERARIAESRCTGLTVEVNELKGFCKMWKGKFERLEKANKKAEGEAA